MEEVLEKLLNPYIYVLEEVDYDGISEILNCYSSPEKVFKELDDDWIGFSLEKLKNLEEEKYLETEGFKYRVWKFKVIH